nr:MAG TPA: hypothetical protein [Caudoviricetes sp.]
MKFFNNIFFKHNLNLLFLIFLTVKINKNFIYRNH